VAEHSLPEFKFGLNSEARTDFVRDSCVLVIRCFPWTAEARHGGIRSGETADENFTGFGGDSTHEALQSRTTPRHTL